MINRTTGFAYDEFHRLARSGDYPPPPEHSLPGSPIELHVVVSDGGENPETAEPAAPSPRDAAETDDDAEGDEETSELAIEEREAHVIATQVLKMVGRDGSPPRQVYDKDAKA